MDFETVVQVDVITEVTASSWGKALLEEILLKASKKAADGEVIESHVDIQMDFRITADIEGGSLVILTPSQIEKGLLTRLPMGVSQS